MDIKETIFVGSFPSEHQCPKDGLPEFAFIGRSNVGKSSLINMLCGRKNLAHISSKPGKTQMLNYYRIDNEWYIVDLPGYGYAKISKKKRQEWERMIKNYLMHRLTLQCAFVLIDANVPPQPSDVEFINNLGEMRVPFVIAYTKLDRFKDEEGCRKNIGLIQQALLEYWNELPQEFETSAERGWGRNEILKFIKQVNTQTTK
ncbi:MAG: ribosome biogenesis GTP-binding protein YihA/YsxC [Saprospiraceae bacterium]|nr:ribosome biogenesis GTP-binding protein YihA/YsxC [Saprospiraceae bacterium]